MIKKLHLTIASYFCYCITLVFRKKVYDVNKYNGCSFLSVSSASVIFKYQILLLLTLSKI